MAITVAEFNLVAQNIFAEFRIIFILQLIKLVSLKLIAIYLQILIRQRGLLVSSFQLSIEVPDY